MKWPSVRLMNMRQLSPSKILVSVGILLLTTSCNKVRFGSFTSTATTPVNDTVLQQTPPPGTTATPDTTTSSTPTPPIVVLTPTPNPTATVSPTTTPNPTVTPIPTVTPNPTLTPSPVPTVTPPPVYNKSKTVTVAKNMTQVDIFLVIDDSSSMAADNGRLAARLAGFVNSLASANLDWQMCVTTTDLDYYHGNPLLWSGLNTPILTPQWASQLNSIVQQTVYDIGSGYSNDERGIAAVASNIANNSQYGCHRPQATLATIIISDEDERSVGGIYNLSSAQYKPLEPIDLPGNLMQNVASIFNSPGYSKKFKVNSIVVKDHACEAQQDAEGSPSFIGRLYMDLATQTQGSIGSICDSDFTPNLNVFSGIVRNTVSSVDLDCTPLYSPQIFGLPSGTNFTLNGPTVSFTPALFEGAVLTINYQCAQ